ncbi:MAG: type II toxin-antitoxin system HipA family toxin [Gemmatimonadetes bacterium]|nr:type II toxin-antitoxin system HipA family toxin [Gemmatimonadota bacterium]
MTLADVRLWGRRIGAVAWDEAARLASFEYERRFSRSRIEVAPLEMPLSRRIYQFPSLPERAFKGLPGLLADSLPDRFGHALIDAWLARRGRTPDSFNPVERLCYIGTRGMGALEYRPVRGPEGPAGDLDLAELVELAERTLRERKTLAADVEHDAEAMNRIFHVGTSAGGARAKAVVAWNPDTGVLRSGQVDPEPGFSHWILKFDGVRSDDDREVGTSLGYGAIEYAYHEMAVAARIRMEPCALLEEGGRRHFMTRRFDRTRAGSKLHMQSLAAMRHFDYNAAGAYSYEQMIETMRALGLPQAQIEQQYRRAIFNLVARNQDDHVKNIAFLMDREGIWSLAPAFDVTYSYNPAGRFTSTHQMSLNAKRRGFSSDDVIAFGRFCDLKRARALSILGEVVDAVAGWGDIADRAGIEDDRIAHIAGTQRLSLRP